MGLDETRVAETLTDDLLAGLPPGPDWSLLLEIGATRVLLRVVDGSVRVEGAPGINATLGRRLRRLRRGVGRVLRRPAPARRDVGAGPRRDPRERADHRPARGVGAGGPRDRPVPRRAAGHRTGADPAPARSRAAAAGLRTERRALPAPRRRPENLRRDRGRGPAAAVPAHGGRRLAPVPGPARGPAGHRPPPRRRLRHALARALRSPRRLAAPPLRARHRDVRGDGARGRRRARARPPGAPGLLDGRGDRALPRRRARRPVRRGVRARGRPRQPRALRRVDPPRRRRPLRLPRQLGRRADRAIEPGGAARPDAVGLRQQRARRLPGRHGVLLDRLPPDRRRPRARDLPALRLQRRVRLLGHHGDEPAGRRAARRRAGRHGGTRPLPDVRGPRGAPGAPAAGVWRRCDDQRGLGRPLRHARHHPHRGAT